MHIEIHPGQPAPDFTLYDTEKNKMTLSDNLGHNVLLLFFPLAFTSVCTTELCEVRDNFSMYEKLDVRTFGISVDSLYALRKYKEELGLNFPLLSDFNKDVSRMYSSLYDNFSYGMKGVSKRSAFVVDKNGIIRFAEVLENVSLQPNFGAIKEILTGLSQ